MAKQELLKRLGFQNNYIKEFWNDEESNINLEKVYYGIKTIIKELEGVK